MRPTRRNKDSRHSPQTLAFSKEVEHWSFTTLRERLQVARQDRCVPRRSKWALTLRKGHGPRFSSPNQPDQERTTAYRDNSGPNSRSDAHCSTIVGNCEEPSGESQLKSCHRMAAKGIELPCVRHQRNWDRWVPDLKEVLAHLVDDIRLRFFDVASADARWSFV